MKRFFFFVIILFSTAFFQNVYSQTFGDGFGRLTTKWLGKGKALDVVNEGKNDKVALASVENVSGQLWKLTPWGNYYRLTNQWQGEEKSLDIVNDGVNNQLQMAESTEASGQAWKITDLGNGFYRLTNQWLGEEKSLDVVNDGGNNKLQMADTKNITGQFWKIDLEPVSSSDEAETKMEDFNARFLHGFKVMVKKGTEKQEKTVEIIAILDKKLKEITNALKPKHLDLLKKVPIWLQFRKTNVVLAWYHLSEDWLVNHGYPAQMVNSVEVPDIQAFIRFEKDLKYNTILHEFGHAYHNTLTKELKEKIITAYENAKKSGKYRQVENFQGHKEAHYAMVNDHEYFAELTVAFFGHGYYVPFTREELKVFDPMGYQLMLETWK
jgi:Ricin-type beta-trefoil lectin domain-like